ncbi:MAG: DUF4956 domain-containing protein [Verrucomicrobiae bacterium]|nr:DUF4956 domain-containing protein [Verrucomicrobiae bacterium]
MSPFGAVLGLVGALSIIRFRAAIKEPEELSYLFICIAIGLGLGAQQTIITVIAFALLVGILALASSGARPRAGSKPVPDPEQPRAATGPTGELMAGLQRHSRSVVEAL